MARFEILNASRFKNLTVTISDNVNWIAGLMITVPLLIMAGKWTGLPTADLFREIFSLSGLIPQTGHRVDIFLFIPLGTVLVVFIRLTLGIRLLGPFRSILLAMAFQTTGIAVGMTFLFMVIGIITLMWPLVKEAHLPYFARVSFVLSTVVILVIATLLAGKWFQMESLLLLAYFPMVVLCFSAEGFAKTLYNEGLSSAMWRGMMTVAAALLIYFIGGVYDWKSLLLHYPEILLAQTALIFLISEHLDFRFFQGLNPAADKSSSFFIPRSIHLESSCLKIAVVRNRKNSGIINRFGPVCPEKYGKKSVQMVVNGLRANGHTVKIFEGDGNLVANLKEFMPPTIDGRPSGMVFNLSYGIQGECRYTHIPAILEMAGVPYTGANPMGHAVSLDKVTAKILMKDSGVSTPCYRVMRHPDDPIEGLRYPLILKPRHESSSYGLSLVRNRKELKHKAARIMEKYCQELLVEEYIEGREFCVGMLGNGDDIEFFPIFEFDYSQREKQVLTWDDKFHKSEDEPEKICPAAIDNELGEMLRDISLKTFRVCQCRDYARVDIRLDSANRPYVLEINSSASLGPGGSYVLASKAAGHTFDSLVGRIVEVAHKRYFEIPASEERARAKNPALDTPAVSAEMAIH